LSSFRLAVNRSNRDHFLQANLRILIHGEYPSSWLARSRVDWNRARSFLQVLDENANFGGQSAAGRPYGKDWHCSLKGSQKTDDGTSLSLRRRAMRGLAIPNVQGRHAHLFRYHWFERLPWDNTLGVPPGAKAPRLYGATLDKNDRSKVVEIVRRLRRTVACEVLRSGDENGRRLRESFAQPGWSSGRSPEWMAKSKPSSTIVAGLSEAPFQLPYRDRQQKKQAALTPYGGGKSGRDGHTNDAFRCSLAATDSRSRVFKSSRMCKADS